MRTAGLDDIDSQLWSARILELASDDKKISVHDVLPWNSASAEDRDTDAASRPSH